MADSVMELREREARELRDQREEAEARARVHDRAEVHREIPCVTVAGEEKSRPLEVHAFGGRVFLNTHGEAVLDREGLIQVRKALDAAFQAVA